MSAHEAPTGGQYEGVADWSQDPPPYDVSTAHPARVYDYLLGGYVGVLHVR